MPGEGLLIPRNVASDLLYKADPGRSDAAGVVCGSDQVANQDGANGHDNDQEQNVL